MEAQLQNKVDMSLDEIIKLSKKEKQQAVKQARARGRGIARGRGQRGTLAGKGRGRGVSPIKNAKQNMQGVGGGVNRGAMRGGGGVARGRGRGSRGRGGVNKQAGGMSPLNRSANNNNVNTTRGRGRGRGAGRGITQSMTFRNSNPTQQLTLNAAQEQRRQRLNVVKAQAALLRKKETAILKLQTAKKTMQDINKALQKTGRANVVNQKRGLPPTNGAAPRGRGRGNKKLLAGLMHPMTATTTNHNKMSGRQMVNTAVTISNQAAGQRRRQWRTNNSSNVTVQLANPVSNQPSPPKPNILEQLKNLKPAVPTTYKFQKNVFATSSTTVSLNDRFSSPSFSSMDEDHPDGRKVYI